MNRIVLSPRLKMAYDFVPLGARLIDIGTDHAYLPIALLESGRANLAFASDINAGPLLRAEKNISEHGLEDRIKLYLSDGFENTECEKNGYTTAVICGMGGELIASVIKKEAYIVNAAPDLILQPMTQAAILRNFLSENGFSIIDETVCEDAEKLYHCIHCKFTGEKYTLSLSEALLGEKNIVRRGEAFEKLLEREIRTTKKQLDGRRLGKLPSETEERLYDELLYLKSKEK